MYDHHESTRSISTKNILEPLGLQNLLSLYVTVGQIVALFPAVC